MAEISFKVPGKEAPGYLRRLVKLSELQDGIREDERAFKTVTAPTLLKMVAFLAGFCEVSDGSSAQEALLDLSQTDYEKMMGELGGSPIPPANGADSGSPTPAP